RQLDPDTDQPQLSADLFRDLAEGVRVGRHQGDGELSARSIEDAGLQIHRPASGLQGLRRLSVVVRQLVCRLLREGPVTWWDWPGGRVGTPLQHVLHDLLAI